MSLEQVGFGVRDPAACARPPLRDLTCSTEVLDMRKTFPIALLATAHSAPCILAAIRAHPRKYFEGLLHEIDA